MLDRRTTSYIGITGFAHTRELWGELHQHRIQQAASANRLLMVGVLASLETLTNRPHRRAHRYPHLSLIGKLFTTDDGVLNIIHYHTSEPESLAGQLTVLMRWAGEQCHGVQLNVAWPDPQELAKFRRRHPSVRLVLQCGAKALRQVTLINDFTHRLRDYTMDNLIDDLLIDPSGGQGKPFDLMLEQHQLRILRDAGFLDQRLDQGRAIGHPLGIGVAGGLGASNLDSLAELLREFPQLSIDAEARLRDGHDELAVHEATTYVVQAAQLLLATKTTD